MVKDDRVIIIVFFILGCAILSTLRELIYTMEKSRVLVAYNPKSDNVIEGEFAKADKDVAPS